MSGKILIVDACAQTGSLLREMLAMDGYEVQTASSAQEAIEKMRTRPADLVVIDQDIPGVFTGELVPALRLLAPFSHSLFRVMFIAMASGIEPTDYQRAGFVYVLRKPFDFEELNRVVGGCIEAISIHA